MKKEILDLLITFENGEASLMETYSQLLVIFSVGGPASASVSEGEQLGNEGSAKSVCGGPCDDYRTACKKCLDDYYKWESKNRA